MRILVADDEPMIRELVRLTLAREPRLEVSLVADGETALEMTRKLEPSLVLLDVRMPGKDGIEACREIRADHTLHQPTIIMLTAMGQDSDLRRGLEAGADEYILKPFSPLELLERVREATGLAA